MPNPLFNALGGAMPTTDGGFAQMMQQLNQFKNTFRGDPKAEVQRLIQSGQMSQQQFNQLGQIANEVMRLSR